MKIDIENFGFAICKEAKDYYKQKESFQQAWKDCPHGDWMIYFAKQICVDIRTITLAKSLSAKTVMHLMKDQRSVNCILVAEKYGRGQATYEELKKASDDALDAYCLNDEHDSAAAAAYYAADINVYHDDAAAAAAAAAYAYYRDDYPYANATYIKNQQATADICREILTEKVFEKFGINNNK